MAEQANPAAHDEPSTRCPLCGCDSFKDYRNRKSARCSNCGSLERGRFLGMVLKRLAPPPNGSPVIHFAPERSVTAFLKSLYGENYVPADADPSAYAWAGHVREIDLTCPSRYLEKESVQGLVHCHILEHVLADVTSTLIEMNDAIQPGGFHVFCVPFLGKHYREDANPDAPREERERLYGQWDHIRAFGTSDFLERTKLAFKGFKRFDLTELFSFDDMRSARVPARCLTSLTSHTVFFFEKSG